MYEAIQIPFSTIVKGLVFAGSPPRGPYDVNTLSEIKGAGCSHETWCPITATSTHHLSCPSSLTCCEQIDGIWHPLSLSL
jgi:hypothetical protein